MSNIYTLVIFIFLSTTSVLAQETVSNNFEKLNRGIVLFSKEGCSRCEQAKVYFSKNEIVYKEININTTKNGNRLMWKYISKKDSNLQNVKLPVLLVNGKINYNIKNLPVFLKELQLLP